MKHFRHGEHHPAHDPSIATFGDKAAEWLASKFGSWTYLIWQTAIVVLWVILNVVTLWAWKHHWDPYPFILLNLVFSTQASYAAPIILLAQNRQAAIQELRANIDHNHVGSIHDMVEFMHQFFTKEKPGPMLVDDIEQIKTAILGSPPVSGVSADPRENHGTVPRRA